MTTKIWNKLFRRKSQSVDPVTVSESVQMADPVIFDVRSDKRQATRTLKDGVQPVFSIACAYDPVRKVYTPGYTPPLGTVAIPGGVNVNNLPNPLPISWRRYKSATVSGYTITPGGHSQDILNAGLLDVLAVIVWLDSGSNDPKASAYVYSGPPANIVWGGVSVASPYLVLENVTGPLIICVDSPSLSAAAYWAVMTAADLA